MKKLIPILILILTSQSYGQVYQIRDTLDVKKTYILADSLAEGTHIESNAGKLRIKQNSLDSTRLGANSVASSELASTSVTAGTYAAASITVDADGRLTYAASTPVGSGSDYADSVRIENGNRYDWDDYLNSTNGNLDTTKLSDANWQIYIRDHDFRQDTIALELHAFNWDTTITGGPVWARESGFRAMVHWNLDATNDDTVLCDYHVPSYVDSMVAFEIHGIANTGTGNYVFTLDWEAYADDEAVNTDLSLANTLNLIHAAPSASGDHLKTDLNYFPTGTKSTIVGGDYVQFEFIRQGSHANDTATGDFEFTGLILYYLRKRDIQ